MKTGREKFQRFSKIIHFFVTVTKVLPRGVRVFFWDCISKYSNILFTGFRYVLLKSLVDTCGDNVRIGTNVQILGWDKLLIGNNVSIHANCYIDANGGISINDNVSIAHNTSILSSNHSWENPDIPIKYNNLEFKKVIIEEDVWLGCGVRILSGVKINKRAIVAAGAVVNKDVNSSSIYGGVPAKLIKNI